MAVLVSSDSTQLPYAYYDLDFICPPSKSVQRISLNIGEVLRGDRTAGSDYRIAMLQDVDCVRLCEVEIDTAGIERASSLIRNSYVVEWILDNLPGATTYLSVDGAKKYYAAGFKLGLFENDRAYINNHVSIVIRYRPDTEHDGQFYIVAFEVYPMSAQETSPGSCPRKNGKAKPLLLDPSVETMTIPYSYSVHFEKDTSIEYLRRWDLYFLNNTYAKNIHWLAIVNALVIAGFLTVVVAIIMLRTLYRDIETYNQLSGGGAGEDDKDLSEDVTGWKLVHGDVFRPPAHKGVLASLIGSGVQLAAMAFAVLVFAALGVLNPSYRGGFMSFSIFLFVLAGICSGYFSSRLYKTLNGKKWLKNSLRTSVFVPGILVGLLLILNMFSWAQSSSSALPVGTVFAIILLWLVVLLPLVVLGGWLGFKRPALEIPVRAKQIARQIPPQPWYLRPAYSVLVGGLIPFAVILIELLFILKSVWQDKSGYYYMYGFLGLTVAMLLVTVIEISIVTTYFQLCAEDYNWWWRSFFVGAGSGVWIFVYSVWYFFAKLEMAGFVSGLLFFSYSFIGCVLYALCTGTVSFLAAALFVRKIYASVKTD
ncbi:uncharacterized protein V1518DRAFT_437431 [Limtongia smithiae]|uniref:uncharacterized protein n=1 Tax=Limtongia smithiae TaxID=1125753 RepID=UPI0034CE75A4